MAQLRLLLFEEEVMLVGARTGLGMLNGLLEEFVDFWIGNVSRRHFFCNVIARPRASGTHELLCW